MKIGVFLLSAFLVLNIKAQSESCDYTWCYNPNTPESSSQCSLQINNWNDLKSFIHKNKEKFENILLTSFSGSDDSSVRMSISWTPSFNTTIESLGRSQETFDGGLLGTCEKLGHTPWSDMLNKYQDRPVAGAFASAYKKEIEKMVRSFPLEVKEKNSDDFQYILFLKDIPRLTSSIKEDCKESDETIKSIIGNHFKDLFSSVADEKVAKFHEFQKTIELCEGLLGMTKWSDFSDIGNSDIQRATSFDERIQCRSAGNNTQDFPKCKSAINLYNVAAVSKHTLDQVQGIRHQGQMMEGQKKLSTSGPFNHTGALEYQKEGIKSMKSIAQQRAVFDSIKLAKFFEIVKKMPTTDSLHESCTQRYTQNVQTYLKTLFDESVGIYKETIKRFYGDHTAPLDDTTPFRPTDASTVCMNSIKGEDTLLRNQKARDVAKQMAVKAGIDVGTNLAKAHLLGKQERGLDGIIKKVEEYDPEKVVGFGDQSLKIEECRFNPNAPQCRQVVGGDFHNIGPSGGSVKITNSDGNKDPGSFGAEEEEQGAFATPTDGTSGAKFSGNITPIAPSINKGSGGLANPATASRLKPGGGVGGSSSGASPGGRGASPGGSSPSDSRQKKSRPHSMQKVGSYGKNKGALRGFYAPKGSGQLPKSRDVASENPFKDLFKNRPKGKSLLFDIGDTESSLFKRISKRYKSVYSKERLLKFEDIL